VSEAEARFVAESIQRMNLRQLGHILAWVMQCIINVKE
jgi:hypothetical protein